jgi:hypothetical protein
VANNFRCKIPHVKAFFAVLTDEQNGALFSLGERELIKNHIPWTRVVADVKTAHYGQQVELLAFIRKERENLVLKPSDEYGGSGVTLGWETGENAWDDANERCRPKMAYGSRRNAFRSAAKSFRSPRTLARCTTGTCWWTLRPICSAENCAVF